MLSSAILKLAWLSCSSLFLNSGSVRATQTPLLQTSKYSDHAEGSHAQFQTDSADVLKLHRRLIDIESVTGNEKEIGNWLATYLEEKGLTVERQYISEDRFNVFAYLGKTRGTKLLVSSHIDTVPPFIPYALKKGNQIWGRGSVDAKACVAAQIIAVLDILKASSSSDAPSIALLFVVGEERGGAGMKYFSAHKPSNYTAVVFGEPTEKRLATGHKGMLSFTLDVQGKAAHSGYPWLGLSANDALIEALASLRALERQLPHSPKLGETTINIGKIEGGVAANVVAEHASADIAIRIAAGAPQTIIDLIDNTFRDIKAQTVKAGGNFTVNYRDGAYGPVHLDTDIDGFDKIGVNYGTDVPNLHGNHKRYLYGPGSILVAHGPNEHLTVQDMEDAVEAYKTIINHLLDN